jgi:Flp pilus assembly protein TadG
MRDKVSRVPKEKGVVLFYMAALLVLLLLFAGLAIDLGRGYIVKAHLSKAVDGAALAAARVIGNGPAAARTAAAQIFNANFPAGYMGIANLTDPVADGTFFQSSVTADGSYVVQINAQATLPTTFMRVAGFNNMNVSSMGEATRRLVDMMFVMDHSGSMLSQYPAVKQAVINFINLYDTNYDRVGLVMYAANVWLTDSIRTGSRGFDKATMISHINASSSTGLTSTAEGLYQGWDQLRRVPSGSQSPLRVIVLFTDGCPNTFPARVKVGTSSTVWNPLNGSIHSNDYVLGNTISVGGLFLTNPAAFASLSYVSPANDSGNYLTTSSTNIHSVVPRYIPHLPNAPADLTAGNIPLSYHPVHDVGAGTPFQFPLYDSTLVGQRPLVDYDTAPTYPASGNGYKNNMKNANNAARNLVEVIANAARNDSSGAYRIRIYTLGLGAQLTQGLGSPDATNDSITERGDTFLMRVANDSRADSFSTSQMKGSYVYAANTSQLDAAFAQIRNMMLRLSQ